MGLKELSEDELAYCQNAVANFNRLKPVILDGELYRLVSPYEGNHMSVMYVGEGQKKRQCFMLMIFILVLARNCCL